MQRNLNTWERVVRLLLAVFAFWGVAVLFTHPVARAAGILLGLFSLGECVLGFCYLHKRSGAQTPGGLSSGALYLLGLLGVQAVLAYEWWSAGWEKVSSSAFVNGIRETFAFFASKNPFPLMKEFLLGFATQNAAAFAYAVEWSQVAIAITLIICAAFIGLRVNRFARIALCLSILALLGGALMNATFYLAAGWTGPGTKGSNVVMFWTQMVLVYVWISALFQKNNR